MKKHIAKRESTIKQHVVETPEVETETRFFELWQARSDAWHAALATRIRERDTGGCLLQYLKLKDFQLVAIVKANSFDAAYRTMNRLDDEEECLNVLPFSDELRSMSPGDVMVSSEGVLMYVAEFGVIPLSMALNT